MFEGVFQYKDIHFSEYTDNKYIVLKDVVCLKETAWFQAGTTVSSIVIDVRTGYTVCYDFHYDCPYKINSFHFEEFHITLELNGYSIRKVPQYGC